MSRKFKHFSSFSSSIVNWMCLSCLFNMLWNSWDCSLDVNRVSSTYHLYVFETRFKINAFAIALCSKFWINCNIIKKHKILKISSLKPEISSWILFSNSRIIHKLVLWFTMKTSWLVSILYQFFNERNLSADYCFNYNNFTLPRVTARVPSFLREYHIYLDIFKTYISSVL